jgi:hypothetical protein
VRWQAALHKFRRERRIADMPRASGAGRSDANDPLRKSVGPKCCDAQHGFWMLGCNPRAEGSHFNSAD